MLKWISTLAVMTVFGFHTLAFAHGERPHVMGTVTTLDAQRLVIRTGEGKTLSILLTKGTKYRNGEASTTGADLKIGDRVVVDATGEGDMLTASEIRFASPGEEKSYEGRHHHRPAAP